MINLRVSPSKGKRKKEEEEGKEEDDDDVWKGVWRKGREVENSVNWEESSLWRRRQEGEKNKVSSITIIMTVRH